MFNNRRPHRNVSCTEQHCGHHFHERIHHLEELHRQRHEFLRHYRYFRYLRPIALLFNIIVFYLLFSWAGLKGVGILFAALIILKEIAQFFFLLRLEKRTFKPMEKLRQGLDEVANGNYAVKVENDRPSDLGFLIASFNTMTAKLAESEKLQTEYEENRKALIANISHDLKTPITTIQGYIEALLDGTASSSESQTKYLQTAHQNIIFVNKLIDDLFLFSKLDMQKLEFHFEKTAIRPYMADLLEEYSFDLGERGVLLVYDDKLPKEQLIFLDGKRFHQAFNNLINNAVQHGPATGLTIQVTLACQDDQIHIDFADNGSGIPADKLPNIFDRFYRIETERPKSITNTGLGLAITKELVEAHSGKITVTSEVNRGTCFTILLPIAVSSESEDCQ